MSDLGLNAFIDWQAGRVQAAEAAARRLTRADPRNPYGQLITGLAKIHYGFNDQGLERLHDLCREQPAFALGHLALGEALTTLKEADSARLPLARYVALMPVAFDGYRALAASALVQGKGTAAANTLVRAVQIDPQNFDLAMAAADLLIKADSPNKAADCLAGIDFARLYDANSYLNVSAVLLRGGRYEPSLAILKVAIALDPALFGAWMNNATALHHSIGVPAGLLALKHAQAIDPASIDPALAIGRLQIMSAQLDKAEITFRNILAKVPSSAQAYINLSTIYERQKKYPQAVKSFQLGLSWDPADYVGWNNASVLAQASNKDDQAISLARRALAIKPDYPEARFNRGLSYLKLGHLFEGWLDYQVRHTLPGIVKPSARHLKSWSGTEPISGRSILLRAEQGLGDSIQFIRYARNLATLGAQVFLEIPAALHRLMAPMGTIVDPQSTMSFDFELALLDLGAIFAPSLGAIGDGRAYLSAPETCQSRWAARLGKRTRPRVGLAYAGNPGHANDVYRSIKLEALVPLLSRGDLHFHVVQKGLSDLDHQRLRAFPQVIIHEAEIEDLADTAAILSQMDLVISVDTAILHLSGAIGAPTIGLIPYAPDWRWLVDRDDTPWYASMRLYRQAQAADWQAPLSRLNQDLAALAQGLNAHSMVRS
jgi:tetratricopeptide (TPR) repeat protein